MFRLKENRFIGSEDDLVKSFIEKFKDEGLIFGQHTFKGEYFEQIRIKEIGRVSDLIIKVGDSRLINIEFKLGDWNCLLNQAKDHLKWADYSYACVPINWLRVFPRQFCKSILENKIGLLVGSEDTFIEVFRAKHNTYSSGKSKELRNKVLNDLKKKMQIQAKLFTCK